jgi:hypothetical protein
MNFLLKKNTVLIGFFFIFCLQATAQDITTKINNYGEKYSPERAYLHYDKSSYAAGETIWFKVYMMSTFLPADDSKNIYVDWLDDKGIPFLHGTCPIVAGVSNGQFDIPADYKGKFIHVRAYTRWMLNYDTAFFYNKDIRIISSNYGVPKDKLTVIPTLTLFPEAGDAIAGINNKIAFKANDQWGRPVKIKGVVISSKGKVVDSLKVLHDGMGYFNITPQSGLTYTVKWKDEKGVEHNTQLPDIKETGASLQVTIAGSNRIFEIHYLPDFAKNVDSIHMVGTMYQHPVFNFSKSTSGESIKGTIPTKNLPTGILTITLFDNNWNPIAERITYVKNDDYFFTPQMEVQHWGLNKRAKNEIKITVPDSIDANLSVSVTDLAIGYDSSSNITSHLLLTSELRGEVYNSAYYFSENSNTVDQNLDLVMLTHGWRRFNWEEVLKGKPQKILYARDTAYMSLSGTVAGVVPGSIPPDASIVLMIKQKDKPGEVVLTKVNPNGTFNDESTILFDTALVYYQFQKKQMKDASAQFMTNRLAMFPIKTLSKGIGLAPDTTGDYRQWYLTDYANKLSAKEKAQMLETVIIKSKSKSPLQLMDEKYASGLFSGGDSYQFDIINDPFAQSATSVFTYLQGKVAGLQISVVGSTPSLQWRGGTPQIYLDEVPVDADYISTLNVSNIAYIKVMRPPFFGGGGNAGSGAIAIYSRKGGDVNTATVQGLAKNKVYGYTPIRQFYAPNYDTYNANNEKDDIRTTLYWNPAVITTAQKPELVLSFFNNDVTKAFRVVIEGITKDGRLAHVEQTME